MLSLTLNETIQSSVRFDTHACHLQKPDFNVLFSVAIGDKPSFQKLVDAGKNISGEMGRNDTSIAYGQNEKVFAITNHQHFLNDYLAGNANNKYDFVDKISGHADRCYI